jgi:hypothetical protein
MELPGTYTVNTQKRSQVLLKAILMSAVYVIGHDGPPEVVNSLKLARYLFYAILFLH